MFGLRRLRNGRASPRPTLSGCAARWLRDSPPVVGANGYRTYFVKKGEPGPCFPVKDSPEAARGPSVFENFVGCIRSRRLEDLDCDILEGHMSTSPGTLESSRIAQAAS
jgi:hypothetical protein